MTDKQIIIDGVDVSGCPHYKTGDCLISPVWCDQFYNCDYKQLKRKEQRIVELNKTIKAKEQELQEAMDNYVKLDNQRVKEYNELVDKYNNKEQECEELKEEIKKHNDDMFKNPPEKRFYCKGCTLPYISKKLKAENERFKETLDELFKIQYTLADNNKKLRQCLAEIKEFVENEMTPNSDTNIILQKISECEGNNELTK